MKFVSGLSLSTLGWIAVFASAVALPVADAAQDKVEFNWDKNKYIIAFGDSYTFIQGTNGYPGYSFLGDSRTPEHLAYTPEELLTTQINQTYYGTSAGGPNWVEFLSGCALENGFWLPSECETQLWDFAFAGADYSTEFLPPHANYSTQMVNQTIQYLTYGEPVIGKHMDKSQALIAIWIGINDIGDAMKVVPDPTDAAAVAAFCNSIVSAMFDESAQWLYDAGYRNFLFVNIPPRDRRPGHKPDDLPTSEMIRSWNSALETHNDRFAAANRAANSFVYDAYGYLNHVMDDHLEYGFQNVSDYCAGYANSTALTHPEIFGCRPLDTYFWFNVGHISSHAHRVLADDIDRFLNGKSTL